MTTFSPVSAAFEGFRLVRREPRAVLTWTGLWLVALSVIAIAVAQGRMIVPGAQVDRSLSGIITRFGPWAALFIPMLLVVWVATTTATFRAILAPEDRRWAYLRLTADELRLAILTAVMSVLVPLCVSATGYLLFVIATPFMAAAPTLAMDIAVVGAAVTVALVVWVFVRLSLIAVETFAEKRFHLTAYWPVTRGQFWRLLASYLVLALLWLGFSLACGLAAFGLGEAAAHIGQPRGGDPMTRMALLGLAGAFAVLAAVVFVVPSTFFCACQAHAFRALYRIKAV